MPQLDFFAWMSMGFWTVLSFHIFYLYMLRNIVGPFAELQKSVQKVNWAISYYDFGSLRQRLCHKVHSARLFRLFYRRLENVEDLRLKMSERILRPNGMTKVLTLYEKRIREELFQRGVEHCRFWGKAANLVPMRKVVV